MNSKSIVPKVQENDETRFKEYFSTEEFKCIKLDPQGRKKKPQSKESPDFRVDHKISGKSFITEIKSVFNLNPVSSTGTIAALSSLIQKLPYGYDVQIKEPVYEWTSNRIHKFISFLSSYLKKLEEARSRHDIYISKSLNLTFTKNRKRYAEFKLPIVTEPLRIREKLRNVIKKAKGKLSGSNKQSYEKLPYVTTLYNHDPLIDADTFFEACLGDRTCTLQLPKLDIVEVKYGLNSLFRPDMNTRISAVAFFNDFIVNGIDQRKYIVLHNPFVSVELDPVFFTRNGTEQWVIDKNTCCPKLIK